MPDRIPLPTSPDPRRAFATEVVARLRAAGFRALWAGGCVRDLILGLTPADYDVATDATPERVMALFRRTVPVGVSFGVVRVLGRRGAGEVEVATFRTDGRYVDGRRPESVTFGSPREDAARRDFTINGMFLDPLDGAVLDFVGGHADLRAGLIRAIGAPAERFGEDKLRLLRAVRFAARFGFEIEPATRSALTEMAAQVSVVAPERIARELQKILVHPARARGMRLAFETGLIAAIVPDLVPLRGLPQEDPTRPGADLWEHTLLVLDRLPTGPSLPLALAALLHDVGRPLDRADHARLGAERTDRFARELRLSNAERERASWLVAHHHDLRSPEELRRSERKVLLSAPGCGELIELERAHALATGRSSDHVLYCEQYFREQPEGPLDPPPLITGDDLVELGLRPGPQFKSWLDRIRVGQLEGEFESREQALAWIERNART